MDRVPVTSSNVKAIGYDVATQDMEVEFLNGGVYTYHDVAPEKHDALRNAASIGAHLHLNFVKTKHPFTKHG